jgi:L-ornithine N5-monooxygenase
MNGNGDSPESDGRPLDTIGVGFGPGNIALAVAYAESGNSSTIQFLEANPGPTWQPGMLIEGSDIQHNPLRDFITPKNPCSKYGYLSYLKSHDRLLSFVNLDAPFPPRSDYARYVQWVAEHFAHQVKYSEAATRISLCSNDHAGGESLVQVDTASGKSFKARSLCFAPGRSKHVPPLFEPLLGENVIHFTDYSRTCAKWRTREQRLRSVAIVGSSQSAVEILLDMHAKVPDVVLHSVFRNFSYVLKDTSPFTEDLVTPEFTDYFYQSSSESRLSLGNQLLRSNYGSVDHDILKKLYFLLYENRVQGDRSLIVHNNSVITGVERESDGFHLHLQDAHNGLVSAIPVDAVILATGFKNSGRQHNQELVHPMLREIEPFYRKNEDGTLLVTRDYQLVPLERHRDAPAIVLNGLCESTHGLGDAGSFSLLSFRAFDIEQGLMRALGVAAR